MDHTLQDLRKDHMNKIILKEPGLWGIGTEPKFAIGQRPPMAETISNARIARALRKNPMEMGYQTTGWTVDLLAQHLADRYGCPISALTLRRRLDQMGLVWRRPRYRYRKAKNLPQKKGRLSAA